MSSGNIFVQMLPPVEMLPFLGAMWAGGASVAFGLGTGIASVINHYHLGKELTHRKKQYAEYPLTNADNPNALLISPPLEDGLYYRWSNRRKSERLAKYYFPAAKVVTDRSVDSLGGTMAAIKSHVQTTGTLDELVYYQHQNTLRVSFADRDVNVKEFLRNMKKVQDEINVPIARRMVFAGCLTFVGMHERATMTETDAYEISTHAQTLKTDVVGALTYVDPSHGRFTARFAKFGADGSIGMDARLDLPHELYVWEQEENTRRDGYNWDWIFKAHRGPVNPPAGPV